MVKFVHFEFVRIKGKRNVDVGAATGVRCWESGMLLVLPGESGMLLVCLEIQYGLDRIFSRREISVDQEQVLLLFILNLRLSQYFLHRTENSGTREIRTDTVHHRCPRSLGGGL